MAGHSDTNILPHLSPISEPAVPLPAATNNPPPSSPTKLSPADRARKLAELDSHFEKRILAIDQQAEDDKDNSEAIKKYREFNNHCLAAYHARDEAASRSLLGSWWERRKAMSAAGLREESKQLKGAAKRECRGIDAWAKEREREVVREWDGKRRVVLKGGEVDIDVEVMDGEWK